MLAVLQPAFQRYWLSRALKPQKQQMCCVNPCKRAKQMSCVVEKHQFLMPGRLIERHANMFRHKPPWQVTAWKREGESQLNSPFLNIDRLVICAETLESELLTSAAFAKCFSTAQNYVWKNAENGRIKCAVLVIKLNTSIYSGDCTSYDRFFSLPGQWNGLKRSSPSFSDDLLCKVLSLRHCEEAFSGESSTVSPGLP